MTIQTLAVIGSGTMGSAIAALAANAGLRVILLDIVPKEGERNALAQEAVAKMKAQPNASSPLIHPDRAKQIQCGNLDDHLNWLSDADVIIEAIVERLDIKRSLYAKIATVRKSDAILASNTSTLPLHDLTGEMDADMRAHFMIMHFFNPPRFMSLLEVVKSPSMQESTYERICDFADVMLGRRIVHAKDTAGFIANRIGVFWMFAGLKAALEQGTSVEVADTVMGKPFGIPKTGIFGLFDLIGIDVMLLIAKAMQDTLPANDPFREIFTCPDWLQQMVDEGYTGRKGKGGFTRMRKEGDTKIKEVLNLQTHAYEPAGNMQNLESLKQQSPHSILECADAGGQFAWAVWSQTFSYVASLIPEISDDIASVDAAMENGYSWKQGPFMLMDAISRKYIAERLEAEGQEVPLLLRKAADAPFYKDQGAEMLTLPGHYQPVPTQKGALWLADVKRKGKPLVENEAGSLWDLGDGIGCAEFHTKMNTMDEHVLNFLEHVVLEAQEDLRGVVIGSDSSIFSAGANLQWFLDKALAGDFDAVEERIRRGQEVMQALKYAPIPIVSALSGLALGGGCELLLHCDDVVAHVESYPGLVEVAVGLVPAWGGSKEMLMRHHPEVAFSIIINATRAASSDEAEILGVVRNRASITMNRARLLADAKARCMQLADNYAPPKVKKIAIPSNTHTRLSNMLEENASTYPPHTRVIGKKLAHMLSAGSRNNAVEVSEQEILNLEKAIFVELMRTDATQERIKHMLKTGKPLAN